MASFALHPLTTFSFGIILTLIFLAVVLGSRTPANETEKTVANYRSAMEKAGSSGPATGTEAEKEGLARFTRFLKNVGTPEYLRAHTADTYAPDAYLDDTIVTHHGPEEIQDYFLQTAETMTQFELTIDDISRSGPDHYLRWTMIFTAPKLGGGHPIHSVGMSQIRFNADGKVAFHQDFWDSGKNIYGQIPLVGGLIETLRNRMK